MKKKIQTIICRGQARPKFLFNSIIVVYSLPDKPSESLNYINFDRQSANKILMKVLSRFNYGISWQALTSTRFFRHLSWKVVDTHSGSDWCRLVGNFPQSFVLSRRKLLLSVLMLVELSELILPFGRMWISELSVIAIAGIQWFDSNPLD